MRKILIAIAAAAIGAAAVSSCGNDDYTTAWEYYKDWRETNIAWYNEKATETSGGENVYTKITPSYAPAYSFLIRFIGERHPENLKPLYTSTATVNYQLYLCNDSLMDEGTGFTADLATGVIDGWSMALQEMNVGDSAEVILPYYLAYGESGQGSIPPYSYLRFNIRLTDIPGYEIRP